MAAQETKPASGPWWKKLAWFVAIYGMSIGVILVVAYSIRFWLGLG